MQNVTLIGGGVLGSQIGFQTAFKGYHVTFYMRSEGSITRTKPKIDRLHELYRKDLMTAKEKGGPMARGLSDNYANPTPDEIDALLDQEEKAYQGLRFETDLAKAVGDADLIIEALTENLETKRSFYESVRDLLPEKTILCTNSSTLLPSQMADATGRPEKFLALHFANDIRIHNTAEVMGHLGTDPAVYDQVVSFARSIGMIPLQLHKEQPGYILNSMLVPFLHSAQALFANEVADPETIDLTWKLATGAPTGPFQILDIVGLKTAYEIVAAMPAAQDPDSVDHRIAVKLKEYIDDGRLGISSGKGFYTYK